MHDTRLSNLLFLSGLAAMAGCDSEDGGGTGPSPTSTATATAGTTEAGSAGDTDAGSSSDGETSGATADPSSTGPDIPVNEVCLPYATWISECSPDYAYDAAVMYCATAAVNAESISPECGAAYEEFIVCATGLDCSTLGGETVPPECEAASNARDEACGITSGTSG